MSQPNPTSPLPNDPVILLSLVNTELRDHYETLDRFCKAHQISEEELKKKLGAIDYLYDSEAGQFV